MALLTGSDLTYYADYRFAEARRAGWAPEFVRSPGGRLAETKWVEFAARQRNGILASEAVSFAPAGLIPEGDALLRSIGVPEERRFFVWLADTISLQPTPPPQHKGSFVILNGARLTWAKPFPEAFSGQDDKGTDVLLRGYAQFLGKGGSAELRLVRKGLHIGQTEELVRQLGIQDNVTWLNELSLSDFHQEIRRADLVCDQFGASFPGMAALDAMALSRPVLANFRSDILPKHFPEKLPGCHAESPEQVCGHLETLAGSPARRLESGTQARRFAEQYLSPQVNARKCLERLGISI
jgi:glycosyltransferase involved in cell wall biosynthesis